MTHPNNPNTILIELINDLLPKTKEELESILSAPCEKGSIEDLKRNLLTISLAWQAQNKYNTVHFTADEATQIFTDKGMDDAFINNGELFCELKLETIACNLTIKEEMAKDIGQKAYIKVLHAASLRGDQLSTPEQDINFLTKAIQASSLSPSDFITHGAVGNQTIKDALLKAITKNIENNFTEDTGPAAINAPAAGEASTTASLLAKAREGWTWLTGSATPNAGPANNR